MKKTFNISNWLFVVSIIIAIGFGAIAFSNNVEVEKEIPVEVIKEVKVGDKEIVYQEVCSDTHLWKELLSIDNRIIDAAAEGMMIASDMTVAAYTWDSDKMNELSDELLVLAEEVNNLATMRISILEKLDH